MLLHLCRGCRDAATSLLPRGIRSGTMTERGREMSDQASAALPGPSAPPTPSDPANNNPEPDVGDPKVEIDEELLIEEVKKFPILYKHAYYDYIENIEKITAWNTVCQSMFEQWREFSPRKKKLITMMVQNKWRKQKDTFCKIYNGVFRNDLNRPNDNQINMNSLSFLIPRSYASDVERCDAYTNTDRPQPEPSTSRQVYGYAYPVHQPVYVPVMAQQKPTPNQAFAHMIGGLLNRLPKKALYSAWPEILKTIENYEFPKRVQIIEQQLIYDATHKTQENVEFSGVATAHVPPEEPVQGEEEEAVQDHPTYPSSYGRPTNSEGEIMYPETDHEDLDEG